MMLFTTDVLSVTIYDLTGARVKSVTGNVSSSIDISHLHQGISLVEAVNAEGTVFKQRLMKQ